MVLFVDKSARSDDYQRSLSKDEGRDDEIDESKNALLMEGYNIDVAQPISSKMNEQVGAAASSFSSVRGDVDTDNNSDCANNNHDNIHRRNDSIIKSAISKYYRIRTSRHIKIYLSTTCHHRTFH